MTYIRCVSCGTLDFDGQFDYHFKQVLCCQYVLVEDEHPVHSHQTVLSWSACRPSLGIDHWRNYVGE